MTKEEYEDGWRGGTETSKLLHITSEYCTGYGLDIGCELDPHPAACVYVDNEQIVHDKFQGARPVPSGLPGLSLEENGKIQPQVHIRNAERLFPDWPSNTLDFVYHSHLIEHIRNPREFLQECARLLKVGGHLVIVGPHKDWYWPVGHPDCNPDHEEYNWQLDQEVVSKWVQAIGSPPEKMQIVRSAEFGWDQDNWSFLVVAQKVSPAETSALSSEQVSPALQNTQTSSKRKVK